jgi:hypothetical protein
LEGHLDPELIQVPGILVSWYPGIPGILVSLVSQVSPGIDIISILISYLSIVKIVHFPFVQPSTFNLFIPCHFQNLGNFINYKSFNKHEAY